MKGLSLFAILLFVGRGALSNECAQVNSDLMACSGNLNRTQSEFTDLKMKSDAANAESQNLIAMRSDRQQCASDILKLEKDLRAIQNTFETNQLEVSRLGPIVASKRESVRQNAGRPQRLFECVIKDKGSSVSGYGLSSGSKNEAKKIAIAAIGAQVTRSGFWEICFETFQPAPNTAEISSPVKTTPGATPTDG